MGADAVFSHIWLRDDWIAIKSHQQLWSLPIPLAGEATHLSSSWDFIPADDGHTVWVPHPRGECWVCIDGKGVVSGRPLVRRGDERLEAVFGQTALVREGGNQTLRLRLPDGFDRPAGEGIAICQVGQFAFVRSDLGATLSTLDLFTGKRTVIPRVSFGCWGQFAEPPPTELLSRWDVRWLRHQSQDHPKSRLPIGFDIQTTSTLLIVDASWFSSRCRH